MSYNRETRNTRYKKDKNKDKKAVWKSRLKKYGIDEKIYLEMLSKQNEVCAICLRKDKSIYKNGTTRKLSVDHDHNTGKVRGLLCQRCNVAIGYFEDNPYICERAFKYLLIN